MPAVVSMGDVEVPDALEAWVADRTRSGSSEETVGGAIVVSCYHDWKNCVLDA